MIIFELCDVGQPRGSFGTKTAEARIALKHGGDPNDPQTYKRYYASVYRSVDSEANRVQESRERLNFRQTALRYRLIDEETYPVVVPYGDYAFVLEQIKKDGQLTRASLRALQQYCVALRETELRWATTRGIVKANDQNILVW